VTSNVGVVDIGSTSIQITVAEVGTNTLTILAKEKQIARLADELDADGCLSHRAVDALLDTLRRLLKVGIVHNARVMITATATLRAAKNRHAIIQRINDELDTPIKLLSGSDEAKLVLSGVLFGHQHLRTKNVLALDVGGGSTELITGIKSRAATISSVPIGALVVHQRWLGFDSPSTTNVRRTRRVLRARFKNAIRLSQSIKIDQLAGTGGTIQRLVRLHQGKNLPSESLNGMTLSLADLNGCIDQLLRAKSAMGRRALPGIDPDRADFLLGGALVFSEAIQALGATDIMVSTSALRTGMLTMNAGESL
jgi:exopolyphosphatase/guanosine-5'-triphosphate,3'-diphosphate pyrophosphatase